MFRSARHNNRLIHIGRDMLALALICLLTVLGFGLAVRWTPRYPVDLSIKDPDTRLELAGLHIPETNGEFNYRWSRPYAFFQLEHAGQYAPGYLASVRLRVPAPDPTRHLTFLLNEQPIAKTVPSAAFRVYHLALPASDTASALRLGLQAPELRIPGDARSLGVVLTRAELVPLRELRILDVVITIGGLVALWLLLRRTGSGVLGTALVCGALGGALIGLEMLSDPAPLGLAWLIGLTLAGALAAAILVRETAARLGLALLAGLMVFSGALRPSWLTDDAFISFRYAQNLANGHGLVYNIGERVEGYTNFLWTILAALVLWLGGEIVWWSYLVGIVLALAILLSTFALARRLLGPGWGLVAALIVATSQSLLIHTARGAGLETGLFTLLVLLGSLAYIAHSAPAPTPEQKGMKEMEAPAHQWERGWGGGLVGLLFALATLTRPEGLFLFGLTCMYLVFSTWLSEARAGVRSQESGVRIPDASASTQIQASMLNRDEKPSKLVQAQNSDEQMSGYRLSAIGYRLSVIGYRLSVMLGVYALIVIPFFLWRYGYYADLLPNTFYAKTGGGLRAALRGLTYAGGFALAFGGPFLLFALVPPRRKHPGRSTTQTAWRGYLLLLCAVYTVYIIVVGGDHFPGERFFVTLVPWLAVLIAGGLSSIYARLLATRLRLLAAPLLAALLIGYAGYAYTHGAEEDAIMAGSDESLGIWREIGWWLADHGEQDTSVAAMSAGAIAFYSERTTIDMLGLTDKHIARVEAIDMGDGAAGHEKRDPAYVLNVRKPTYIPQMWEDYYGGPDALRGRYQLITITTRYGREIAMWRLK